MLGEGLIHLPLVTTITLLPLNPHLIKSGSHDMAENTDDR